MIKVVKHGSVYRKFKEKCGSCNCVFTFNTKDIEYDYDLNKFYICCPECNNIIRVKL